MIRELYDNGIIRIIWWPMSCWRFLFWQRRGATDAVLIYDWVLQIGPIDCRHWRTAGAKAP